ncbi:MAG: FtsX-like permease family protein, partial [Gemmatimonadaceae bacterium]
RTLVVAQIALSQPLLVLLGVMLSLVMLDYQPMAPDVSQRVISVGFRPLTQTGAPGQRREAVDSLRSRIASLPEVTGVVPEAAAFSIRDIIATDRVAGARSGSTPTTVRVEGAAPGWFALLDVPILLGRDVSLEDTVATDYPIVIGSDLARTLWGDANPLGRTLASPASPGTGQDSIALRVIGVFDVSRNTTRGNDVRRVYTARERQWRRDRILVRTRGGGEAFVPTLRTFIRDRAPGLPVTSMLTIAQMDAEARLVTLKVAALVGSGGATTLLLASLGLYGVISLAVRQRRREIGIRIAVGAKPMRVARMFLASGVRTGVLALLIGLPLSIAGLRVGLSTGFIIAPEMNVWLVGIVIAAILLLVAAAATWLPARRAATIDPAVVLRVD